MTKLSDFISDSSEFFGIKDNLDMLLSNVDQQELDSMFQSSKALVTEPLWEMEKFPSKLSQEELDQTLQLFYAEVRKADSSHCEPESLCTMLAALDKHLHESNKIKDWDFEELRNYSVEKLHQQGKGNRNNKADAHTPSEIEQVWTRKAKYQSYCVLHNQSVHMWNLQSLASFSRPCPAFHHLQYVPVTESWAGAWEQDYSFNTQSESESCLPMITGKKWW